MSYELRAILEYDAARIAINELKKPLFNLFQNCDFAPYLYTNSDNCIRLMRRYEAWERDENYEGDEPEYRHPCEKCKQALAIFADLKPARKRFGIAKTRLSRISRDHRNSTVLCVDDL